MDSFQLHQDSNSIKTRDRTFLWCFVLLSFPFRSSEVFAWFREFSPRVPGMAQPRVPGAGGAGEAA